MQYSFIIAGLTEKQSYFLMFLPVANHTDCCDNYSRKFRKLCWEIVLVVEPSFCFHCRT